MERPAIRPRRFPDGLPPYIPATLARLQRRLPAPGTLSARIGSHVEPDDVIGRCSTQPDPILLHVAAELGVEASDIGRYIRRDVGARVGLDDIVARQGQRVVVAPVAGVIEAVDIATGFVMLMPDPLPASVTAMLRGYVIEIEDGCAATVETPAAVVQGAVGWGEEQWGTTRVLVGLPDGTLDASQIDDRCAFEILIGNGVPTLDALRAARREQVKAIIVGSIDSDVLHAFWGDQWAERWQHVQEGMNPLPADDGPALVLTEGLGQRPMNDRVWDVLTAFDGQELYVDPATSLRAPQRRPRIIAPVAYNSGDLYKAASAHEMRPDAIVRLLDEAHLGTTARLEHTEDQGLLASGVRAATATVVLSNGEQVVVPVSALDILE
jgi:hypothetical protein